LGKPKGGPLGRHLAFSQAWRCRSVHSDRNEAKLARFGGKHEQRILASLLPQAVDPVHHVLGRRYRLLRYLGDHHAWLHTAFGGCRILGDFGDDHAVHIFGNAELAPRLVVQFADRHAKHGGSGHGGGLVTALARVGFRFLAAGQLLAILEPPERHLDGHFLALANKYDLDRFPDGAFSHDTRQVAHVVEVLAVELDDDVSGLDLAIVNRPALYDAGYQCALGRIHAQALGDLIRNGLDAYSQPAAARLPILAKLLDDTDRHLGRNGKADADRAAGGRYDSRVYADHLAVHVEQRTTGISAIDGRIRLDEIIIGPGIYIAVAS